MTLQVRHDASLRALNTLRVEAHARMLVEADEVTALPRIFDAACGLGLPWLVLGEGSNVLFVGDFDGVVVRPRLPGIEVLADDGERIRIRAGAGENWHRLVEWTVDQGLAGLENLALIPGSVGAAPVQNIGAYGVELDRRVAAVEAFDIQRQESLRLDPADCGFGYRDSRFKREPGRWLITAVEFDLSRQHEPVLDYAGLREELDARGGSPAPSPRDIFDAVCAIRRRKLPDPALIGNAGSFFKNPVVADTQAAFIADHHPDLPAWPAGDGRVKLSAAWLIERCGFRGHRRGDAGVSAGHALVLVNHGNASGAQLWALARDIRDRVEARFGVGLEPEPRVVGDPVAPDAVAASM